MTWIEEQKFNREDFEASSQVLPLSKHIAEAVSPHDAMWANTISGKTVPVKHNIYVLVFTEVCDGFHC